MKPVEGAMPSGPTRDVEEQESSAEPATLLGGGSMTALPKSCLKKAESVPSTQVRGITWNGVFVTKHCEPSMLGHEIAFPERVIDVLVESQKITLGRTLYQLYYEADVEKRVEVVLNEAAQEHMEWIREQMNLETQAVTRGRHNLSSLEKELERVRAEEVVADEKFAAMEAADKKRKNAGKELGESMIRGAYEQPTESETLDCLVKAEKWLDTVLKSLLEPEITWTPELVVMREARLSVNAEINAIKVRWMTKVQSMRRPFEKGVHV